MNDSTTSAALVATERECAAGRTAPRVSLDDIEANIAEQHFVLGAQAVNAAGGFSEFESLDTLTLCLIVTHNGFTIIGKSAPASAANFDPVLGRKLAYEDAVRQLWPLMGYALRERLLDQKRAAELPAPEGGRPLFQLSETALEDIEAAIHAGGQTEAGDRALGYLRAAREERQAPAEAEAEPA